MLKFISSRPKAVGDRFCILIAMNCPSFAPICNSSGPVSSILTVAIPVISPPCKFSSNPFEPSNSILLPDVVTVVPSGNPSIASVVGSSKIIFVGLTSILCPLFPKPVCSDTLELEYPRKLAASTSSESPLSEGDIDTVSPLVLYDISFVPDSSSENVVFATPIAFKLPTNASIFAELLKAKSAAKW